MVITFWEESEIVHGKTYPPNFSLRVIATKTRIYKSFLSLLEWHWTSVSRINMSSARWKMMVRSQDGPTDVTDLWDPRATDTSHKVKEYEMKSLSRAEFFFYGIVTRAPSTFQEIFRCALCDAACAKSREQLLSIFHSYTFRLCIKLR